MIEFKFKNVAASIASRLAPSFGSGFNFYEDPNMQGTTTPCAFIQQRTGRTQNRIGGILEKTIGLDVTVLLDYDDVGQQEKYQDYAEKMDALLNTFTYSYTENNVTYSAVIRCVNRTWNIDAELHYKFDMVVRLVEEPAAGTKMQTVEITGGF